MRPDRAGRLILLAQALSVGAFAVMGLDSARVAPAGVGTVAGFTVNVPHGVLLLVTALGGVAAALWSRISRLWVSSQAVAFTLLFVVGAAGSLGGAPHSWLALNGPDHFLHLGLAVLGGVLATSLLSRPALVAEPASASDEREHPSRDEESDHTRRMIEAEVAVGEGHASPEQAREVREEVRQRTEAERRRAWQAFES